jgi:biopolymer transport protein ExbB/TolQ
MNTNTQQRWWWVWSPDGYKSYAPATHFLVIVAAIGLGVMAYGGIVSHAQQSLEEAIRAADVEEAIYRKDPNRYEYDVPENLDISKQNQCERLLVIARALNLPLSPETESTSDRKICAKEGSVPPELGLLNVVLERTSWPKKRPQTAELLARMIEKIEPGNEGTGGANPRGNTAHGALTEQAESSRDQIVNQIASMNNSSDEQMLELMFKKSGWLKTRDDKIDFVWCVSVEGPLESCDKAEGGDIRDSQQAVFTAFFIASLSKIRADENVRKATSLLTLCKGVPQMLMLIVFFYALFWQIPRTCGSMKDWWRVRKNIEAIQKGELCGRTLPDAIITDSRKAHAEGNEAAIAHFRSELAAHRSMLQAGTWPTSVSAAILPMLSFIGTTLGIMKGLGRSDTMVRAENMFEQAAAVQDVAGSLGLAFGTTFIGLSFVVILTILIGIANGVEAAWMSRLDIVLTDRITGKADADVRKQ